MALKLLNLSDTVELMNSDDYKERFKAEYYQLKYRYQKLHFMILKYEADKLDFKPTCEMELLREQRRAMEKYLHYLELRAVREDIEL